MAGVWEDMTNPSKRTYCLTEIDTVHNYLSLEEFFVHYMIPNKPCLLGPWATASWPSRKDWVSPSGGTIVGTLCNLFGECSVPVADCGTHEYSSHSKSQMLFKDYMQYWSEPDKRRRLLYLKDWHLTKECPAYEAYSVPECLKCDWLNEFFDVRDDVTDDYRFVYMGVKGTWTPFHADVFRSYSWSANICGRKRWLLFPPGEEEKLRNRHGELAFDVESRDLDNRDEYPNYGSDVKKFEVIQEPGFVIFVPSGWHHQVWNLEDTISINHNWLNGCSIDLTWEFLRLKLREVEREIDDVRDMEGWAQQCQVILKADQGMHYEDCYWFLCVIIILRVCEVLQLYAGKTLTDRGVRMHRDRLADTCDVLTDMLLGISWPTDKPDSFKTKLYLFDIGRALFVMRQLTAEMTLKSVKLSFNFPKHESICYLANQVFEGMQVSD